jgi:hypothetical protein
MRLACPLDWVDELMARTQRLVSFAWRFLLAAAFVMSGPFERAWADGNLCPAGWWGDLMIGSHHIHPDRHFDDFNPGVGFECSINRQWAPAAGYFRNSLDRPSFYAGALFTPKPTDWRWVRLGAMAGIISGYNYGRFGVGGDHRTGPLFAPVAITQFGRFGVNFILVPPIRQNDTPFTLGFQARYRFK